MNTSELTKFGVQELNAKEMVEVDGGAEYVEYSWSNTDNELVYAAEAVINAGKAIYNGGVWVLKKLGWVD